MAEDNKRDQSQQRTTSTSSTSTSTTTTEKNLKVELLALSWERLSEDGTKTVGRYSRGDVIEVPESVVNSANSSSFKPAFRVLEDN